MIIQVVNNPDHIKKEEIVVFFTGKQSVNTFPKFMRIGEVISEYGSGCEIKELATGKIWKPYSADIIQVGQGIPVFGVEAKIKLTEKI